MTTFTVDGVKLGVSSAGMIIDLQNYYAIVYITTLLYIPLGTKIEMKNKSATKLVVLNGVFEKDHYYYTCVSEEQYDMLSVTTPPVQEQLTVKNLINKLGLKTVMKEDSNPTWWSLPSLSFKGVVAALNKWAEIPNGGAARFYMDFGGNIMWADLKLASTQSPVDLLGDVGSDNENIEWMLQVPGSVKFVHSDNSVMENEDVVYNDKFCTSKVLICDHTTKAYELKKRAYSNEFNYRLYMSRQIVLDNVQSAPHYVGQCVKINDTVQGVVSHITIPIQINDEDLRLKVKVSCQGLLEQK